MTAVIYKVEKNAMQSGKFRTNTWLLEYKREIAQFTNDLMGWVGEKDMKQEICIQFPNEYDAISYAERENIPYDLIEPKRSKIKMQSYADNFK